MDKVRDSLSWLFAISSLISLRVAATGIIGAIRHPLAFWSLRYLLAPVAFSVLTIILGFAWWTIWRRKTAARIWGIAASLTYLIIPLSLAVYFSRSLLSHFSFMLAIGAVGLVAFARPYEHSDSASTIRQNRSIPGDGTISIVNRSATLLGFVLTISILTWWGRWLHARNIPRNHDNLLSVMLVFFLITFLHEFGHVAVGLAFGMRLRAFLVGPFQWRIYEGQWKFQFKIQDILIGGGATAVVPTAADFSSSHNLWIVAAGPVVNLATGFFAILIAFRAGGDSPLQVGGLLVLFGVFSLVLGAGNLFPFRTGDNYSDGARIYQLLAGGPWADFHRVTSVVTSSLVTPLRPKDYDIELISRAAEGLAQGKEGLLLRLFAHSYFLDQDRMLEAAKVLSEADSIYHQSASDISAELFTVFVFGNAYVRRDAVAAREWWTRMEAKKRDHFNVDYWRAYSALHWIEGHLKEANEGWSKSNELAQRLPKAGAYEFDRHCCAILSRAIDEAVARGPGCS